MTKRQQTNQRGTALIAVLWVAILLSGLLVGALAIVRVEARGTYARGENLKAQAAVKSGLLIAATELATGATSSVSELNSYREIVINGYNVDFTEAPESKKLDINLASEQALQTMIEFAGLETKDAQVFAARIADWRDADDLSRPNGAETSDYATARNGERIGNRPFYSVDELELVLGFPDHVLKCIAPALTVFGESAAPDAKLMSGLFGENPFNASTTNAARLSTSGRATRTGQRIAVMVNAKSDAGRKEGVTGIFRSTGRREVPYEMILAYKSLTQQTSAVRCVRKNSHHNNDQ